MSRQARARSSFAVLIIVVLAAGVWIAGRGVARTSESGERSDAIGAGNAGTNASGATKAPAVRTTVFPVPGDFQVKLIRAGLDAKALCAAGVAPGAILSVLQSAADNINGAPTALDSADAGFATSNNTADALVRKMQSGKASQEEIASYPAAKTALLSAQGAQQSVLDGYFSAATANLSNAQRLALTNIRANKGWELPTEYLVVNRTETEWVALRDALANERIAAELPGTLSQTCQALLATVRADPAVAAARTNIQANIQTLTNSWNTAVGN